LRSVEVVEDYKKMDVELTGSVMAAAKKPEKMLKSGTTDHR